MGFFQSKKVSAPVTTEADTEKEETTANKARLLATEGQNKGSELTAQQGASIRKVFGG